MLSVIRINLLYLQTVLITAGPGVPIYNSNASTEANGYLVNFTFCPSKANTWKLKSISCNRNETKQYVNRWQITEVSNFSKRQADNSGNHAGLWPLKICHYTVAQLYFKFLFITQHKVPFINTSEATKRSNDRTGNSKCTNVANRRNRVGKFTHFAWTMFSCIYGKSTMDVVQQSLVLLFDWRKFVSSFITVHLSSTNSASITNISSMWIHHITVLIRVLKTHKQITGSLYKEHIFAADDSFP